MIRILFAYLLFLSFMFQSHAQTDSVAAKAFGLPDSTKFIMVGTMPTFRGTIDTEFYKYIQENLIIPKDAKKLHIKGTVFVQYIIDANGKVTDVIVVPGRGLHPLLDKAAVDVIANSPDWSPGTNNGIPVRVKKVARINFM